MSNLQASRMFVNLPVKDLNKSIEFFTALGFTFDLRFADETAICMVLGENLYAMLMTHAKFDSFSPHPRAAEGSNEVLICLQMEARELVDATVAKAVAAGGRTHNEPQDHGFMYGHSFIDLDGHAWELMHMSAMPPAAAAEGAAQAAGTV